MKFKDKVVLVTGASRGIGRATAIEFAKEGADIALDYHVSDYEPDAESNVKKVESDIKKLGRKVIAIECDVSQEEKVKDMVRQIIKKFSKIDILVNNAGVVFDVPFTKKPTEQWRRTLETNILGTMFCSKHVASEMKKKKAKGTIVNISSTNGINCLNPFSMDYDVSKAGINLLTKNLAIEFSPDIRVNCIAPGWVDTEMNAELPKEFVDQETKKIYLERFAQPEEIAKVVLFLASEDGYYINGEVIKVDGGYGNK